jgi:predicted nucleotidyltransferase
MRTLDDIRDRLWAELPYLRERYDVDRLGICGSYVREEQTDDSDLDLLVTFTETPGLFEVVNLKHYLEDTMGLSVDLGMPGALKEGPAADNIRREVEYL